MLVGFGNWNSQKDSIIRGHRRGPVVALKRELKRWSTLKLVDEYCKNIFKIFKCALEGKPRPKAYCRVKIQPKEKSR